MTEHRFWGGALLGLMAACAAPHSAFAETAAPAPQSAPDPAMEAQKSAFLAMPEADRTAVQDALGWLGLYNGAVDGAFGKRTRDSILAYQRKVDATADGTVTAAQLAALKAAAQKARAAVGFELIDERTSGVRIGAPLKILDKIATIGDAATLEKAGGAVTLAFQYRIRSGGRSGGPLCEADRRREGAQNFVQGVEGGRILRRGGRNRRRANSTPASPRRRRTGPTGRRCAGSPSPTRAIRPPTSTRSPWRSPILSSRSRRRRRASRPQPRARRRL